MLSIALLPAAVATAFLKLRRGLSAVNARAKLTTRWLISFEKIKSEVTSS